MVGRRASVCLSALGVDEAFIGLFIVAMHASGHMSAAEGARAHHVIWSMKRFRRQSGEDVGRTIEHMRLAGRPGIGANRRGNPYSTEAWSG